MRAVPAGRFASAERHRARGERFAALGHDRRVALVILGRCVVVVMATVGRRIVPGRRGSRGSRMLRTGGICPSSAEQDERERNDEGDETVRIHSVHAKGTVSAGALHVQGRHEDSSPISRGLDRHTSTRTASLSLVGRWI